MSIEITIGSNVDVNHYVLENKLGPFFWRSIMHDNEVYDRTFRIDLNPIFYYEKHNSHRWIKIFKKVLSYRLCIK